MTRVRQTVLSACRRRPWLAGIAAGVAVLVIAGVVLLGSRREPAAAPQAAAVPAAQRSSVVDAVPLAVPDIRLTAAAWQGARTFALSQDADRPTLLFAMASWCISCIPEARALVQLQREVGDRVNILVLDIDPDDTEDMLERFARAAGGAPGVWALDRGSVVTRAYNIRSLDTTIVIAGGREVSRTFGPQSVEQLRGALAKAQQAGQ